MADGEQPGAPLSRRYVLDDRRPARPLWRRRASRSSRRRPASAAAATSARARQARCSCPSLTSCGRRPSSSLLSPTASASSRTRNGLRAACRSRGAVRRSGRASGSRGSAESLGCWKTTPNAVRWARGARGASRRTASPSTHDPAAVGPVQQRGDPGERGLAAAAGAQQPEASPAARASETSRTTGALAVVSGGDRFAVQARAAFRMSVTLIGWWHSTPRARAGGVPHASLARSQRGANAHPLGRSPSSGGSPGIGVKSRSGRAVEQPSGVRMARPRRTEEVLGVSEFDDPSRVHHGDPVGDALGRRQVVGDHQQGAARVGVAAQFVDRAVRPGRGRVRWSARRRAAGARRRRGRVRWRHAGRARRTARAGSGRGGRRGRRPVRRRRRWPRAPRAAVCRSAARTVSAEL